MLLITRQAHRIDASDEQTGAWYRAVQHLERQIAVLIAETEALHNATCQVLQCSRGETRLQVFIAAIQPANGITPVPLHATLREHIFFNNTILAIRKHCTKFPIS